MLTQRAQFSSQCLGRRTLQRQVVALSSFITTGIASTVVTAMFHNPTHSIRH